MSSTWDTYTSVLLPLEESEIEGQSPLPHWESSCEPTAENGYTEVQISMCSR